VNTQSSARFRSAGSAGLQVDRLQQPARPPQDDRDRVVSALAAPTARLHEDVLGTGSHLIRGAIRSVIERGSAYSMLEDVAVRSAVATTPDQQRV